MTETTTMAIIMTPAITAEAKISTRLLPRVSPATLTREKEREIKL